MQKYSAWKMHENNEVGDAQRRMKCAEAAEQRQPQQRAAVKQKVCTIPYVSAVRTFPSHRHEVWQVPKQVLLN